MSIFTACALPSGYNLYMFGRLLRRVMCDCDKGLGLNIAQYPNTVEIIWEASDMSSDFFVYFDNTNWVKCNCSHNRKEFSDLLKISHQSEEVCNRFDKEGRYSTYVGESKIFMSLIMDGNDFKQIKVELAPKQNILGQ